MQSDPSLCFSGRQAKQSFAESPHPTELAQTFIAAARSYLGVPFRHLGRSRRGLDCAGLAIVAAHDAGFALDADYRGYGRRPDGASLRALVARHCRRIDRAALAPGDLLLFAGTERLPCHLAIVSDTTPEVAIVHAWAELGRVAEHVLAGFSGGAPVGAYRPNELEDS